MKIVIPLLALLVPAMATALPEGDVLGSHIASMKRAAGLFDEGISAAELHKRDCVYRRHLMDAYERRDECYKSKKRQDCGGGCPAGCVPPC